MKNIKTENFYNKFVIQNPQKVHIKFDKIRPSNSSGYMLTIKETISGYYSKARIFPRQCHIVLES